MTEEKQQTANKQISEKHMAWTVYIIQAVSIFTQAPLFMGVILNYVTFKDVRDTWLESHFLWQIRTFWYYCLWMVVGFLTIFILPLIFAVVSSAGSTGLAEAGIFLSLFLGCGIIFFACVWLVYRIIKGGYRLYQDQEMYATAKAE